jgi:photosystem II stability/assembly factor-like uncharacterized protein
VEVGEGRTRRAVAWIGVAAVGTLVAGVVYLRPSLGPPAAAAPAAPARVAVPAGGWRLASASFGDADHGTVQFYSSGQAPATTYLTSDGGKTWQVAARARNGYAFAAFLDSRTVFAQTAGNPGPAKVGSTNPGQINTRVSDDAGRTWRQLVDPRLSAGPGLPGFLDRQHAWWIDRPPSPDPHTPVVIWRTSDGGRTWHELVASGLPVSGFPGQLVFTDPVHGMLVFTAPDRTASASATSDGGETWRTAETPEVPLQGTRVLSWTILRHGQRLLWWLLTVPDTTLTAGGALVSPQGGSSIDYTPFVSVSDDGGRTWSQPLAGPNVVQPGYVGLFARVDARGRLLLVDDRRLWISEDEGATWASRLMQAPADLRPATLVSAVPGALFAMAAQTGLAGMVTLSTPLTLIRSTDDGAHWSAVNLPRLPAP